MKKKATVTVIGVLLSAVLCLGFVAETYAQRGRLAADFGWLRIKPTLAGTCFIGYCRVPIPPDLPVMGNGKRSFDEQIEILRRAKHGKPIDIRELDIDEPIKILQGPKHGKPFDIRKFIIPPVQNLLSDDERDDDPPEWEGKSVDFDSRTGRFFVCNDCLACEIWWKQDGRWMRQEKPFREDANAEMSKCMSKTAAAQAKDGNFQEAMVTAQRIENDFHRGAAFISIAEVQRKVAAAQAEAGDFLGARQSFSRALEAVQRVEDDRRSRWNRAKELRSIAVAQARVGNFQDARLTAQHIKVAQYRSMALRDIEEQENER